MRKIAIDGPAGAGKSTVGALLAQRLDSLYIDTGALYRALTWLALQQHIALNDEAALIRLLASTSIVISPPQVADGRLSTVMINEHDVTWALWEPPVTRVVSLVSAHRAVRERLIEQMRALATRDVVMVGRDIGTVVLPDAELKVYLDASLSVRARRRYQDLVARLGPSSPDLPSLTEVYQDLTRRDALDRLHLPPAHDAVSILTDDLTIPDVVQTIREHLPRRTG